MKHLIFVTNGVLMLTIFFTNLGTDLLFNNIEIADPMMV